MNYKKNYKKIIAISLFVLAAVFGLNKVYAVLLPATYCSSVDGRHYNSYREGMDAIYASGFCADSFGNVAQGYGTQGIERLSSMSWKCTGWNGSGYAVTDTCSASWDYNPEDPICPPIPEPVYGTCGGNDGETRETAPASNLCAFGNASAVTTTATGWTWTCSGASQAGPNQVSCSAINSCPSQTYCNGICLGAGQTCNENTASCGPANNVTKATAPTSNLCSEGTASSVTTQNGKWSWTCTGNTPTDSVSCLAPKTGCPSGQNMCNGVCTEGCCSGQYECNGACIPNGETCCESGRYCNGVCLLPGQTCPDCESGRYCNGVCLLAGQTCSTTFIPNPNIIPIIGEGPVILKKIVPAPTIGNSGYTCIIDWSDSTFNSYDNYTKCTFSTPTDSIEFSPASTTAPTSYSLSNVRTDTLTRMTCVQMDGSVPPTSVDAVCRVNWSAVEVN